MNLQTTIDLDLKGFFQWWGRELAFLVPKKLRQALREHQGLLVITPDEHGFSALFYRDEEDTQPIAKRFTAADPGAYTQFKQRYPALEKAESVLRLNADQALHKVIYLPAAAQENLAQVLTFELDRYTPFKADQVYFSSVILDKTEQGPLRLLLILTPQARLDEQLMLLSSWGIHPQTVDYQPALSAFPQTLNAYNLLPARYRAQGDRLGQSMHWLLSGIGVLLALSALVWPVWQQSEAVDSLKTRIKILQKQTQVIEAQQQEIDAIRAETQKLIDIKQQSPALLAVLNELSKLLNDETWLTHLQFSETHVQIQGQSPAASALIGLLEASDFFSNVSFVSPLTQDKTSGRERFQISMDITMPGPAPSEAKDDAGLEPSTPEESGPTPAPFAPAEESADE